VQETAALWPIGRGILKHLFDVFMTVQRRKTYSNDCAWTIQKLRNFTIPT